MSSSAARPLQESKPVARESSVTTLLEADEPTQTPEPKNPKAKPKSEPGGRSENQKKYSNFTGDLERKLSPWSRRPASCWTAPASAAIAAAGYPELSPKVRTED
jgi:hypothetical protein